MVLYGKIPSMNSTRKLLIQTGSIPAKPGIYLYRDRSGTIIYVGKALNLKKRVRSYFTRHPIYSKTAMLVSEIAAIDYYVTENEVEALIMESNFIKENRPAYNVVYRDDKSYPYLAISIKEEYPRIRYTREPHRRDTRYFGPYTSANAMRETLDLLIGIFPIRSCRASLFARAKATKTPCLYYHINRCVAPCAGKVSNEEYQRLVAQITAFLEGRQEQVITDLVRQMKTASANLEFEKAAHYRDRVASAKKILSRQKVSADSLMDQDVFGLAVEESISSGQLLKIRNGKMIGTEDFILNQGRGTSDEELLGGLIKQYYLGGHLIPKEVLLPLELSDSEVIATWLSRNRGGPVKVLNPKRGLKHRLTKMAAENAVHSLERFKVRTDFETKKITAALSGLKETLALEKMDIIECYDISTIFGQESVGSMVTFKSGRPERQAYRKFKLRRGGPANDYAMMKEVLSRRFSHFLAEDEGRFALKPDLVIVDGGKPQLKAALEVFSELEIVNIPVAALAKKEEELYLPGQNDPIVFPRDSGELHLLQRIRDEAHRFAITYHRGLRRKAMRASGLDSVAGIGPHRKKQLLRRFGSVKQMRLAGLDELRTVVDKATANELYRWLKDKG